MFFKKIVVVLTFSVFSFSLFPQSDGKEEGFKIGGAVRYNMLSTHYEDGVAI